LQPYHVKQDEHGKEDEEPDMVGLGMILVYGHGKVAKRVDKGNDAERQFGNGLTGAQSDDAAKRVGCPFAIEKAHRDAVANQDGEKTGHEESSQINERTEIAVEHRKHSKICDHDKRTETKRYINDRKQVDIT